MADARTRWAAWLPAQRGKSGREPGKGTTGTASMQGDRLARFRLPKLTSFSGFPRGGGRRRRDDGERRLVCTNGDENRQGVAHG